MGKTAQSQRMYTARNAEEIGIVKAHKHTRLALNTARDNSEAHFGVWSRG